MWPRNPPLVEEFDVDIPPLPPRSALYALPIENPSTALREGLLSYIVRLARAYSVNPRRLIREVFPQSDSAFEKLRYASFFTRYVGTLDGLGHFAETFAKSICHLTGGVAAHQMTLLPLKALFPINGAGLLVAYPKWCPDCIRDMVRSGRDVYRPLVWSFDLYTVCHVHGHRLAAHCEHCSRTQPFIPKFPDLGRCAYCLRPLVNTISSEQHVAQSRPAKRLDRWVSEAIADLVEHLHEYSDQATQNRFAQFVKARVDFHTGGNRAAFCRALGLPRWVMTKWLSAGERPGLPQLLTICYGLQIFPSEIFLIDSAEPLHKNHLPLRRVPEKLFQRAERPLLDTEERRRIVAELEASVADLDDARPLAEIARGLGQTRSCLSYWFPELCAAIRAKHAAFRQRKSAERQRRDRAAVVQAVRDLKEQGEYPGRKKVDAALRAQGVALIRPELMQVYRAALLDKPE
ncbi:MAG: TniQ family protein [Gammaproteobacteria bacterium]|nr:TniQ family protein [Gammaproteobacteria bacterium]